VTTRYFGERIRRNEDPRLLTGAGTFVDDVAPPNLFHAALLRSPHAHARVRRVDTTQATALAGVAAVYTYADLPPSLQEPLPRLIPHPALVHHKTQYALAHDKVRHVGEPVAFVVATNRYVAEDALDLIEVEYDPLPPVVTLEQAVQPEAPLLHEDAGTNICAHYTQHVGNVDEAFAHAAHVFTERFVIDRGTAAPMECRGVVAEWHPRLRQLMVGDSTQAPIPIRDGRIVGVKTVFLYDSGAYIPYGIVVPIVASTTLPGPYKIPNYRCEFRAVFTNKTTVSPYRGAGRPHGVFVMERLMDRVARELGIDRMEVRRRNFIQPHEFPYDVGLIYQDNAPLIYDSGNYPATLDAALQKIGYDGWVQERTRHRAAGRYVGLGVACYVEGSGIGPYEGCRVTVEPSGKVY